MALEEFAIVLSGTARLAILKSKNIQKNIKMLIRERDGRGKRAILKIKDTVYYRYTWSKSEAPDVKLLDSLYELAKIHSGAKALS